MNDLQIFKNDDFGEVRVIEQDGEPWFVAVDVCAALGLDNNRQALTRIDDEEKGVISSDTLGGVQEMGIVSESGLYALVMSSRKPEAKGFQRWVRKEVLPAIRKTGAYAMSDDMMILVGYTKAVQRIKALEEAAAINAPKVEFFDAVADSKTALPMASVAKVLGIKGIGRNKLFEILRLRGVLQADNVPYQEHVDAGRFRVLEQKYTDQRTGEVRVATRTLVYQRGVDYIRKMISDKVSAAE